MEELPKIARQRLRATAQAGVHPDPDLLAAFAEKTLHEREGLLVLQHLGQCADCRQVVSLAMAEIVAPPVIRVRSPWLTWPVLRWGGLAACVVVVAAAVTLRYERRQDLPTSDFQKTAPAPAASQSGGSPASSQPAQKLAANIAPPSPLQADRDLQAGKLAKPGESRYAGSAASGSTIPALSTGAMGKRQRGNTPPGTGRKESDELRDNRLARADRFRSAEALESMDKPSAPAPPTEAIRAPARAARSKAANTEADLKARNENLDDATTGSSETVMVQAEPTSVETAQAAPGRAKDEANKKLQKTASAGLQGLPAAGRNVYDLSVLHQATPSWTLSPDGALQRSFDSGKTWQTIPIAGHVVFRALAANESDIWVGGSAGALYHSADAGWHWTQVKPVAEGTPLTADITGVEFTDRQHGRLITGSHETWTTADSGASWHRK